MEDVEDVEDVANQSRHKGRTQTANIISCCITLACLPAVFELRPLLTDCDLTIKKRKANRKCFNEGWFRI